MCFIGKKIRATSSKDGYLANGSKWRLLLSSVPWLLSVLVPPFFEVNASKLRKPLDTVDLEELPDSRERTGAPVLWLSCEGQTDIWELFSDISSLSAILDRQGLLVAAPVDLRTKKAESFLGSYQFRCDHFSGKCKQIEETFGCCGSGRTSRLV